MIEINLLPGSQHREKTSAVPFVQYLLGWQESLKDRYLAGAIAAIVIALLAVVILYTKQSSRSSNLDERELRAVQDSARYTAVLTAKKKAEATRDSLYRQLAVIKSIDDSRFLWPHLLEEVSAALPPYTWLTSILQTSAPPNAAALDTTLLKNKPGSAQNDKDREKKRKARADSLLIAASQATHFRIVGHTVDLQALTRFIRALEASPFIQNVQLTRSELILAEGGKEVTEFLLEAESERPTRNMIRTVPLEVGGGER